MRFVTIILLSIAIYLLKNVSSTIDMNAAEFQYIADHLTPEECRTLVAAAQFQNYENSNVLDQAGICSSLLLVFNNFYNLKYSKFHYKLQLPQLLCPY